MRTLIYVFRSLADLHLKSIELLHLLAEGFTVGFRRTEHLQLLQVGSHMHESRQMGACHAARPEHADDGGILARHVLCTDAAIGADARELQHTVVDESERLAILGGCEEDEAAIEPRLGAVLLLRCDAVVALFVNDIGFHANRKVAAHGATFHAAPTINLVGI